MPEDQPDTTAHTIVGDGTIPADATVRERESGRDDEDSSTHACACGYVTDDVADLIDHDCGDDDGPDRDPDPQGQVAMTDGGTLEVEAFRPTDFEDEPPAADEIPGNRAIDGTRPTAIDCPQCGAVAGERCEFYGGKGAELPKKSICIARRKALRRRAGR